MKRYAEDARRAHGVNAQIRVGINAGEVVVRAIGSDLRMDYTAVGQTTHLAARMEQLASPGSILLTPSTLDLVEGLVAVRALGSIPVKGLADAVEVHELTGPGPARTRLQAAARRGLTRFVGRDTELEQLGRAQQLAGAGRGQVAAIVGAAGVGKSRLVYEFTHSRRISAAKGATPPSPPLALPRGLARPRGGRGLVRQDDELPAGERALEICRVSNLKALAFHGVAAFLGGSYAWSGRVADAIVLLDPVVAQTAAMGAMCDHLIALIPLGEAHLLAGKLDEARRLGTRAVDVSVAHRERGHQAWALRLLGEVAVADPRSDGPVAEEHYRQALRLADELGMRPLVVHCHLGLGKVHRREGTPP